LREQIAAPIPFDSKNDFHTLYCWTGSTQKNTLQIMLKKDTLITQFCECSNGKLASVLTDIQRKHLHNIEPLLPKKSKETSIYFFSPLQFNLHTDFQNACKNNTCAFESVKSVLKWTSFPAILYSKKFKKLKSLIKAYSP